nr:outer membrane protein assembly factor [Planctomycetota bacterium]
QFRVRFREPRLFGSLFSFETSVYKRLEFREDYRTDRLGYKLGIGYPLYQRDDNTMALFGEVTWRHENIDIDEIDPDAVPGVFLFENNNELRSLTGSLSFVTRNDSVNPTFETSTRLSAEYAGGFLGGDLDYWKLLGRSNATWVVHEDEDGKKHRIAARVTAGVSEAFGNTPEVPPYERFYAGGRTFRGFEFRGVGPHVNGQPTGGEFQLISSLEYEFPILARTLSLVAFSDQGTLGTSIGADDAFRWRWSVGFGLRFAIPFLTGRRPMALDFGFPIYSEDEDEEGVFSFSLGRDL